MNGIIEALQWAVKNPNHGFASMLPDINHKNEDIYEHLCKFNSALDDMIREMKG